MVQLQILLGLPAISFANSSTVVGTLVSIVGLSFAGQEVVLITKYPVSFSHSMTAPQSFADITGGVLGHGTTKVPGTTVVVVVVANDVRTVSEGILSLSFLM